MSQEDPQLQPGMGIGTGCIHCGPFVGVASCGCGKIYQCRLLKKWCGKKQPIDEFVTFLRRELNKQNHQCCKTCNEFVAEVSQEENPSPG